MELWVTDYDGKARRLPEAQAWSFRYGLGSPCDSFEVSCLWAPGAERALEGAVRFRAEEDGRRLFTGVVDEYSCVQDGDGSRLELSGRGMQALLLDNEALPVEYQLATAEDIVRRHVSPYGISLAGGHSLGAAAGFTVSSGQSEWSVVRDFACFHGGIVPRFDRLGRLVLSDWENRERTLDGRTAVTGWRYGQKRYGVLSQVVVRDRTRGFSETVDDAQFQSQGGQCRRVLTMAGRSNSAAMRFSGQFQLRASRSERETCEFVLPETFAAWPGELVWVERTGFGGNGVYRVRESAVSMDGGGMSTRLLLGPVDLIV